MTTTESEYVRFSKPKRNNGEGNEDGPIVGIEVTLAVLGGKKREWVYWTTDGKEGTTAYSSLASLMKERELSLNANERAQVGAAKRLLTLRADAPTRKA